MAVFYLDTAASIKRYRREPGTEVVDQILEAASPDDLVATSFLSVLELAAAVRRLQTAGYLGEADVAQVLAQFGRDLSQSFDVWPVDNQCILAAEAVVHRHRLRAADAIHLAAALAIAGLDLGVPTVMVTSDQELLRAAIDAELATLDPTSPQALDQLAALREAPPHRTGAGR